VGEAAAAPVRPAEAAGSAAAEASPKQSRSPGCPKRADAYRPPPTKALTGAARRRAASSGRSSSRTERAAWVSPGMTATVRSRANGYSRAASRLPSTITAPYTSGSHKRQDRAEGAPQPVTAPPDAGHKHAPPARTSTTHNNAEASPRSPCPDRRRGTSPIAGESGRRRRSSGHVTQPRAG